MTQPAPPLWRVQTYQSLASTQDAAIAAAQAGDPGRLAIIAETQSAGRGSRGRHWAAPAGNLNFSALLRPAPNAPLEPGRWALLAGLALHRALSPYAGGLMLKWPNDLLLNGAKLGGILIDSTVSPEGGLAWLVIGIGANLAQAPDIPGRPTACLPPPGATPAAVARALLDGFDRLADAPTSVIVQDWLSHAHPVGTPLTIHTASRTVAGAFNGLTQTGEVLLHGHAAPISSGEVFLGLPAGTANTISALHLEGAA